jgi:hypothetical protein
MSIIPLDVQRRFERRWAAQFSRPTESESVAPRNQGPEGESLQIVGPDKSKTIPGGSGSGGLATADLSPAVIPRAAELFDPLTSR